jgi:hypothetical protein
MRAFEVYVNGERLCVAGVSAASVLTVILDYVGRDEGHSHLRVGGLLIPEQDHVYWLDRNLGIGDDIRIKVIESEAVDAPVKRYARDPKKEVRDQKRYVRTMAKQFGWKIQTGRKRA